MYLFPQALQWHEKHQLDPESTPGVRRRCDGEDEPATLGEPEEQIRAPFENLMSGVAEAFGWEVVCTGETPLPDRLGRSDFAVHRNQSLAGYVELKAPGAGANAKRFKGRNRKQFKRFSAMPNMLYTDGNEWALYQNGELTDRIVELQGDV